MSPCLPARPRAAFWSLLFTAVVTVTWLLPAAARAQIFVANNGSSTIGEYDTSGGAISASLLNSSNGGINFPLGLALSGSNLFVANSGSNTIGEYTTSGGTVTAPLVTGLASPGHLAVSGSDLFVTLGNSIGEYDFSGTLVHTFTSTVSTGLQSPLGIAVSGSTLYSANITGIDAYNISTGVPVGGFSNSATGSTGMALSGGDLFVAFSTSVVEYDATTGASVNTLVTGLTGGTRNIAVSGSDLYLANQSTGKIDAYSATTGALDVSFTEITGLSSPYAIAVVTAVPEPSTWGLLAGCAITLFTVLRRRRDQTA